MFKHLPFVTHILDRIILFQNFHNISVTLASLTVVLHHYI